VTSLPFLTSEIPAAGGVFKATPDDFIVEEMPAYEPTGGHDCEHLFLWIEKRGHSTQDVAKALARHCGFYEKDISWAGLKDRHAVTRQYLCAPARKVEPKLETFSMPGVQVLRATRHRNKLKSGHLHGNRFELKVREVKDAGAALAALEQLTNLGVPNYFGEQRFGFGGDNAEKGKQILLAGGRHGDRFERKLFLSAYQSELFNRVLASRITSGTYAKALLGDVLKKVPTGGEFFCAEPEVDQLRVDKFEVSPSGPIFGPEMRQPTDEVDALESRILSEEGIERSLFEKGGGETLGTRRPLRVPVTLEDSKIEGDVLHLRFTLPAGSYATVLLRELIKE
jgi:tRNA pseudouridine13 synthase